VRRRGKAFSLVEIMVVLVIMAVVAGAVTLRLEGPLKRASMRELVDCVAGFDRLTRVWAREQDRPVTIVVDMAEGELSRVALDGKDEATAVGSALVLPERFEVAEVRTVLGRNEGGRAEIPCSRRGFSASYALCLEDDSGMRQWILFAGLTGQMIQADDERQVQTIFEALAGKGRGK